MSEPIDSPDIAPPDPDAVDTRDLPQRRRRRAGGDEMSGAAPPAAKPVPKPAKKAKGELWGFDDEEDAGFAEWKLGLILVLSLMAGFGVVAWKKYDTLKAMASEKIEKLTGGPEEEVVAADRETPAAEPTAAPEAVVPSPVADPFGGDLVASNDMRPPAEELPSFDLDTPSESAGSDWASAAPADAGPAADPFGMPAADPEPVAFNASEPAADPFGGPDGGASFAMDLGGPPAIETPVDPAPPQADPFMEPVGLDVPETMPVADGPPAADPFAEGASVAADPFSGPMEPLPDLEPPADPEPAFGADPLAMPEPIEDLPAFDDPPAVAFDPVPTQEPEQTPSFDPPAAEPAFNEPPPSFDPVPVAETPAFDQPSFDPPPAQPEPPADPTIPQRVDVAKDTRTHLVENGETFWSISKSKYGTPRYFAALAEWNRGTVRDANALRPGVRIELPPADVLEPIIRTARVPQQAAAADGPPRSLLPQAREDRTHTVQSGETYWSISKSQYGTVRYFAALAEWNRRTVGEASKLKPGKTIELPAADKLEPMIKSGAFPAAVAGEAAPNADTGGYGYFETPDGEPRYRVGPTDTLSGVAQVTLGRASRWRQIYAMNRDALRSPDVLPKEAVLKLPPDAVQLASRP